MKKLFAYVYDWLMAPPQTGIKTRLICERRKGAGAPWEKVFEKHNILVKGGLAQFAALWGDAAAVPFTLGKIGIGTTGATVNDAQLANEVDEVTGTFTRFQTTHPNDSCRLVSLHTAPVGGWAITEYAAAAVGTPDTLWNRVVFAAVNLAEDEQLQFTYEHQVTEVV